MFREIAFIIGLTMVPGLELRASIPYGIFSTELHWMSVFTIAVLSNIVLGTVVYSLIDSILHLMLRFSWFKNLWSWYENRIQHKIHKKVERYGDIGIALFIGVPLPGSGSISGAVAANLLGMSFKRFFLANMIGVVLAAIVVTAICLFGDGAWSIFIKQ